MLMSFAPQMVPYACFLLAFAMLATAIVWKNSFWVMNIAIVSVVAAFILTLWSAAFFRWWVALAYACVLILYCIEARWLLDHLRRRNEPRVYSGAMVQGRFDGSD